MAKPRPITGIDPRKRLAPNARRILAVRIDEVWAYGPAVVQPGRVRELHDMRIACKRLRYLLEIFAVGFTADLDPFIEEVRGLQDILGDIHDRDVQVPMLHAHLAALADSDESAARRLLAESTPAQADADADAAFARFRAALESTGAAARRPGIVALVERRARERDELYERFLAEWRRLQAEGFRRRLERALGIP